MGFQLQARLPSLENQSWEEASIQHLAVKIVGILFIREKQKSVKDTGNVLKVQCTKSCSQPYTLDYAGERAECSRVTGGESGVCGSGEEAKGTAARIPVLCRSPIPQTPSFLGGALPPHHQRGGKKYLDALDSLSLHSKMLVPC